MLVNLLGNAVQFTPASSFAGNPAVPYVPADTGWLIRYRHGRARQEVIGAVSAQQFSGLNWLVQAQIAAAAAFAPNPDSEPFYADLPLTTDGALLPDIWERWLDDDPLTQIPNYRENPARLAIAFDVGEPDNVVTGHEAYSQALTAAGVPHSYETYPGDHFSGIQGRIETRVLPFCSEALSTEPMPSAVEGVTWGKVKRTSSSW